MNKVPMKYNKITGMILILVVFTVSACQAKEVNTSAPIGNNNQVATIVAATMSVYPSLTPELTQTPIPTETSPESMTYVNKSYGFSFDYPSLWMVMETIVPKGTHLTHRSFNRFDVGSDDYDTLIVEVAKGSEWILEITARKTTQSCGGYASNLIGLSANDINYQSLEILGRNAIRLRPEDGYAWKAPDSHEPYPVIVAFPNNTVECPSHDKEWMLFSFSNNQIPLSLDITYYSNQFTDANLQNRTIDYSVVQEMDKIVENLRLIQ